MASSPPALEILGILTHPLSLSPRRVCPLNISRSNTAPLTECANLAVREPDGFTVWSGPPYPPGTTSPPQRLPKTACSATSFSTDGARLLATVASASATVYDCRTLAVVKCFELPGLLAAALSPTGAYLQTFQKSSSPQEKNVTVWHVDTAAALYQHYQKSMSKATWYVLLGLS